MTLERLAERLLDRPPTAGFLDVAMRHRFMTEVVEPVLHRELDHRGLLVAGGSIATELLAWLESGNDIRWLSSVALAAITGASSGASRPRDQSAFGRSQSANRRHGNSFRPLRRATSGRLHNRRADASGEPHA